MPTTKLTSSTIEQLTIPEKGFVLYRDQELRGFALRITANGSRSFLVNTSKRGRCIRLTLGDVSVLTVPQARDRAKEVLGKIAAGIDPRIERYEAELRSVTLSKVLEDYLKSRKSLSPRTEVDFRRHVERGGLSRWKDLPISAITKDMVEKRHSEIGVSSHSQADQSMRYLRALFNYAAAKYELPDGTPVVSANPCRRLTQLKAWYGTRPRRTLVRPDQLKDWFKAVLSLTTDPKNPNGEDVRDFLIFVLMTGLRRSEATRLTWDRVDLKRKVFQILETKNKLPHALPLPGYLMEMLTARHKRNRVGRVFLLSDPWKQLVRARKLFGDKFGIHDLRRSFITIAESLDIPAYSLKMLLNHKTNDVTAGYIVIDVERLRVPMQKISDYILRVADLIPSAEFVSLANAG